MFGSRTCGSFITCMNINLARAANFSCINQSEIAKCCCEMKFIFVGTGRKLLVRTEGDTL